MQTPNQLPQMTAERTLRKLKEAKAERGARTKRKPVDNCGAIEGAAEIELFFLLRRECKKHGGTPDFVSMAARFNQRVAFQLCWSSSTFTG